MIRDEANAELRIIPARLYAASGAALPLSHVFAAGDLKLVQPDETIANATNLPTPITGAEAGSFEIQLERSEIQQEGTLRLQLSAASLWFWEWAETIEPANTAGALAATGVVTLESVREIVRTRGDRLSSLTFTNTYINTEIQAAWRELYELMDSTNEGWWDAEGTVTTTASTRYVALPADCWRVRGVDILDGTDYIELDQVTIGVRNRYSSSADQPVAYRLSSRGIELFPTPNAAYTLRVTYSPKCPALDETSGIELFGWQEFVIEGALLRLDKREEKPIGERWKTLYDPVDGLKVQITRAANKRKQQEPEYLLLREGAPYTYEDPY